MVETTFAQRDVIQLSSPACASFFGNVHHPLFLTMVVHLKLHPVPPPLYEVASKLLILLQFFLNSRADVEACLRNPHSFLLEAIHQHLSDNLHHTQKRFIFGLQHPRIEGFRNIFHKHIAFTVRRQGMSGPCRKGLRNFTK